MNILLTSVGRRSYLVKYFKDAVGGNGQIHVSNSSDLTPAFRVADKSIITPLIYDKEYIPFLLSYCKENEIDILISLFDVDLLVLSESKELFKDIGTKVIISNKLVIDICNDKIKTYNFLINNGFNAPKTYSSIEESINAIKTKNLDFPVIIKPRWGMGSIGVFQADNEEELRVLYKKTLNHIKDSYLRYESDQNLKQCIIIQEKLEGQEYGLDVINDLNKGYQNTIVKLKHSMRSGETDCAETVNNIKLKQLGSAISEKLGHVGNLDVDVFIVNENPYILEMNARFGGGYPFSHIAGVNLPKAIIGWAEGKEVGKSIVEERFGVLSHKDIGIVPITLNSKNNLNNNGLEIKQLKYNEEILELLHEFDDVFTPSISNKVKDLSDYADKLTKNAYIYVAANTQNLGFVTLYANNYIDKIAYISFIGVCGEARNKKIGRRLLNICYETSKRQGMKYIKLEVQKSNHNAIKFYKKNEFTILEEASENSFYMLREI